MGSTNSEVKKLPNHIKKIKPEVYKFEGHPVSNFELYVKELYATMLCCVALYDDEIVSGPETEFLRKIILGLGLNDDLNKYMSNAGDVNDDTVLEFVKALSDKPERFNYIIDSIILAVSAAEKKDKKFELIAEVAEILKITKREMEFLSKLALNFIERNGGKFNKLNAEFQGIINLINFNYYLNEYVEGYISSDDKRVNLRSNCHAAVNLGSLTEFNHKSVLFENAVIDLSGEDKKLHFNGCETVNFKNCEFVNGNNPILFNDCVNITIEDCVFKGFSVKTEITDKTATGEGKNKLLNLSRGYLFKILNSEKVEILRSLFMECKTYPDIKSSDIRFMFSISPGNSKIYGCLKILLYNARMIYFENSKLARIYDSKFMNCEVSRNVNLQTQSILKQALSEVQTALIGHKKCTKFEEKNNIFTDCKFPIAEINEENLRSMAQKHGIIL